MTSRIGLLGGRGYVGEELLRLLCAIPEYSPVYIGSHSSAGQALTDQYPDLPLELTFQDLSPESLSRATVDFWIIAQANGVADSYVQELNKLGRPRIIDISSDFRFDEQWTYGLAEANELAIRESDFVSNPGCYATATQLALLPIVGQLRSTPSAFGVSGYSGAGRTPNERNDPKRLADNLLPYSLIGHTHEKEVSHHLKRDVRFMPHVASFFRGISVTVDIELQEPTDVESLQDQYTQFYARHALVEVSQAVPEIKQVTNTNGAVVGGFHVNPTNPCRVAIVSVIDNLRKGAASQVIQNLNLMNGLESTHGLI